MPIFAFLAIGLFVACSTTFPNPSTRSPSSIGPTEHAFSRLRAKGVNESFLQLVVDNYKEEERTKVLDLNLLGFLRPRPTNVEPILGREIIRIQDFLHKYRSTFSLVEKKFPVPRQVIASLLWVETKHGRDLGKFHTASTFFSLSMADYPTILDQTIEIAKARTSEYTPEVEKKIIDRSAAKAEWAANELLALQQLEEKNYKDAVTLKGSFAGAFGVAQFLPSSYLSWAKGKKSQPNLFDPKDAIFSVANYLTSNGWRKSDRTSQEAALFHYNRDKLYVEKILKMSECAKHWPQKRRLASRKVCQ